MCGVFGFCLNKTLSKDDIALGEKALGLLKHRGPDGQNLWYDQDKGILLGHTRLAIIDLSAENAQPIHKDDGVMVFNGEIYNYKSLKKRLTEKGHRFRTSGDTEVLMTLLNDKGSNGITDLDGMFALAHYRENQLTLATDYFGEKPLYIYRSHQGIYFSSEASALIKLLGLKFKPTREEQGYFMGLGFLPASHTGYENLEKVPPATCLTFDTRNYNLEQTRYWNPSVPESSDQKPLLEKDDIRHFQDLLIQSVESRLEADVPVGVFLSAGVDSMLIAAILKKELSKDNTCITVSFQSDFVTDESTFAKKSAEYLGLNHLILDQTDTFRDRDELQFLSDTYGEPNDNLTLISAYAMSLKAREHVKVALSGTGGDELFFGYNKYAGLKFIDELKMRYGSVRPLLNLIRPFKSFSSKLQRLLAYLNVAPEHAYLLVKNYPGYPLLSQYPELVSLVASSYNGDIVAAGRDFDVQHTLPNSYIPYIEHGSMQASLEVRAPFLNRELYELTHQFRAGAFLKNGQKWVLKSILEQYLPKPYFDLPKMGFVNPREDFLTRNINDQTIAKVKSQLDMNSRNQSNPGLTDLVLRQALLDLWSERL